MARHLVVRGNDRPSITVAERLLDRLESAMLVVFWGLAARLPVRLASRLGGSMLARLGPLLPKQRHVLANLAHVRPDADGALRAKQARGVWRNLGRVLAEYPHLGQIVGSRVDVRFEPGVRALMAQQRPIVFCAGHVANWELAAAQISALGIPLTAVYARVHDTAERHMTRYRGALGCNLVEKQDSARHLVAALRRGESIGLVADQRVDDGEEVPFFGRPARTATTPARLALRFDAPLVPVRVERLPGARFRVHFLAPIATPTDAPDDRERARLMTAGFMALLEEWVRTEPAHWLCMKRRWPKARHADMARAAPSCSGA